MPALARFLVFTGLLAPAALPATPPRICAGSTAVGSFRLSVVPPISASALPLRSINALRSGCKIVYEPLQVAAADSEKAEVTLLLVTSAQEAEETIEALNVQPASQRAEWVVSRPTAIVALILGPQGLDVKKVSSLVSKNRELVPQLADYAEQTANVELLVEGLTNPDKSSGNTNLNAALVGFSSRYGVATPKLDGNAPTEQQAQLLLTALMPALSTYDPLATQKSQVVQQSVGLAAAVAGLFFGSPVGLAAGGAAMFQNMRTLMFPDTDFRSAFAQTANQGGMALCAKPQPARSRTRVAYLWASRIPGAAPPKISIAGEVHLPVGVESGVRIASPDPDRWRLLPRARDWQLVSTAGSRFPVGVTSDPKAESLSLDLSTNPPPPGNYRLEAKWDWDPLPVDGVLQLHAFAQTASAALTPESEDRLIQGSGPVSVTLAGVDFQFVEKVAIYRLGDRGAAPLQLPFTLPQGKRAGVQNSLDTEIDTTGQTAGRFMLLLTQSNGKTDEIPVLVHPPLPKFANVPLRLNVSETTQSLEIQGTGLDRLTQIRSDIGEIEMAAGDGPSARTVTVRPKRPLKKGDRYALTFGVKQMHQDITLPDAIEVIGSRPRITSNQVSFQRDASVQLRKGELPANTPISIALRAANLDGEPVLDLTCGEEKATFQAGDQKGQTRMELAGEGLLFVSLLPADLDFSGCDLSATVSGGSVGRSDPFPLGRIVRLPRVDSFELTDEKLADGVYVGILTGEGLEMIDQTGWGLQQGLAVSSIPTPTAQNPGKQTLRVPLPWPAPAPRAPVYVWLRGENAARATTARF